MHCASVRFAVRFHSHYQPSSVIARLFTLGLTPRPTNEQNKQHRYFVANVLGSLLRPRACNLPRRGDCAAAWAGAGGRSSSNAVSNTLATRGTEIVTFRCSFRVPILKPKTCATKCNEELALGAQFSEPEPGLGLIFCMLLLPLWRTSPGKTIIENFPTGDCRHGGLVQIAGQKFPATSRRLIEQVPRPLPPSPPAWRALWCCFFGTKNPIPLVPILGLISGTPNWAPPFILFRWSPFWVPEMGPKTGTGKMAKNAPRNAKILKKNAARRRKKLDPEAEEIVLTWVPTRGVM